MQKEMLVVFAAVAVMLIIGQAYCLQEGADAVEAPSAWSRVRRFVGMDAASDATSYMTVGKMSVFLMTAMALFNMR